VANRTTDDELLSHLGDLLGFLDAPNLDVSTIIEVVGDEAGTIGVMYDL
jgi:hypothetical protein